MVTVETPLAHASVASPSKIAGHWEKLESYLRGAHVMPATLELDITSRCTRECDDCPSNRSPDGRDLSLDFTRNLLASFEGQTRGLLMTGGEATMSPNFPDVLSLAESKGFDEISVVTNGFLLDRGSVSDALVSHASTIRVSMYDWAPGEGAGIAATLARISHLRDAIEASGSGLQIGISALTDSSRAASLSGLTQSVRDAGAHWIYFHPLCRGWDDGRLVMADQRGVTAAIDELTAAAGAAFGVHYSPERYSSSPLSFRGYHAAHFLLVIGADGKNYLGAEVKYQDNFAIADVATEWRSDFLHHPERLARIAAVTSDNYYAVGSRHRGVLYNDFVDRLMGARADVLQSACTEGEGHMFPHIL